MAEVSIAVGAICTFLAAVFFGIQYVPCKQYSTYDGATFQWFMCAGIMWGGIVLQMAGMLIFNWGGPQIILYGVLSGMIWGSANFLVIPLVRICGLALGFALYHIVNLSWGYCLSRFGLFGMEQDVGSITWLRDMGVFILLISFAMLFFVEPEESDAQKKVRATQSRNPDKMSVGSSEGSSVEKSEKNVMSRKTMGVLLAIAAGVLTAMNGWPYGLWSQTEQAQEMDAVNFVFSQCVGIYMASSVWYWLSATVRQVGFKKRTEHSVIRPAFVAGLFWVIGDVNMLYGIDGLGYATAYTLDAVGPVMVASVLSLFWFKEIQDRKQRMWFWASFAVQCVGCFMVSFGA